MGNVDAKTESKSEPMLPRFASGGARLIIFYRRIICGAFQDGASPPTSYDAIAASSATVAQPPFAFSRA